MPSFGVAETQLCSDGLIWAQGISSLSVQLNDPELGAHSGFLAQCQLGR